MKTLLIMVGIPGSGKSYYAKHHLINKNTAYISRDEIRFSMITDEDEYFKKEKEVFNLFVKEIKEALNNEIFETVIADATHLNWASRNKLLTALGIREGKYPDLQVIPVMMNTPFNTVIIQNKYRSGRAYVPISVIRRMSYQITDPKNDPYKYTEVFYVY